MIKKTITYTDYNGNSRTEDFYFNLNQAEILEMELSTEGGLEAFVNKVVAEHDTRELCALFKNLVLKAYGVKSLDGKRFEKSQKLRDEFEQTEAYVQIFTKLTTDTDAAVEFFNGIIPKIPENKVKELNSVTN